MIIIIVLSAFVALVIGIIIYSLQPRAYLLLSFAPDNATLVINGKEQPVKTGQEVTVTPGTISLEIKRDGFDSYNEKVSIKNGEREEILVSLNPLNDAARELLKSDASLRILQRIGGKRVVEGAEKTVEAYPLLSALPIKDKFYIITACASRAFPEDKTKVAICIGLYDLSARQAALDDIESRGYKLPDYEIIINDFTNVRKVEQSGE